MLLASYLIAPLDSLLLTTIMGTAMPMMYSIQFCKKHKTQISWVCENTIIVQLTYRDGWIVKRVHEWLIIAEKSSLVRLTDEKKDQNWEPNCNGRKETKYAV